MKSDSDAHDKPEQIFLRRPMPKWVGWLTASSVALALAGVLFWMKPAFHKPDNSSFEIKPGTALYKAIARQNAKPTTEALDIEYNVIARKGDKFSVAYIAEDGKRRRIDETTATEVYGYGANNQEVKNPDGTLVKRWTKRVIIRDNVKHIYITAQSKHKHGNSLFGVTISVVNGFHGQFDACTDYAVSKRNYAKCSFP